MSEKLANPWRWIPSLYFGQGIPYVVVMTLSVIMYKNLGFSNTDIALYTSWLYLPWVIKPLWSPLIELFHTKRSWIIALQFLVGVALAMVALTIPGPQAFQMTLAVFWLMAFASASHDIAADGFYMLALPQHSQAYAGDPNGTPEEQREYDLARRNFLALMFCLMVGTAGLPHLLTRYYTSPTVAGARASVAWSL
ncbi:MAG: hypothetical protein K2W93_18700, partial [Burkholderiaceae bacterium]|nr:hypothetical protein [Burkholderiaceae bacterium]